MTDKELFLKAVHAYGLDQHPFELRFLKWHKYGIHSGYYTDVEKAYVDIKDYWHTYTCYFSLQEIDPSIVARRYNCLEKTTTVTTDADIESYRYLHVDVDPKRKSGIQANKKEVHQAMERMKQIMKFLKEQYEFVDPILVFSGNGFTADYPIQKMRANQENKTMMHNCLKALDILFSDETANIDVTVANPARIIKLPGTISAKGCNTKERPYRMSQLLKVPSDKEVVSRKQLKHLAEIGGEEQ